LFNFKPKFFVNDYFDILLLDRADNIVLLSTL